MSQSLYLAKSPIEKYEKEMNAIVDCGLMRLITFVIKHYTDLIKQIDNCKLISSQDTAMGYISKTRIKLA